MDQVFKGWLSKLSIAMIPVLFPLGYVITFLSVRPEPFQQAAGNALYLFVLLAAENISLSLDPNQASSASTVQVFYTIVAVLLWAGLSFIGLFFVPLSEFNYLQLAGILMMGLVFGLLISRTNFRLYGLDYVKKQDSKEKAREKRISKDPGKKAKVGDNAIDI